MPFPESPRFTYKKNPLISVICQIKFPAILKIDTEIPSEFQEKIRSEFPIYKEIIETVSEFPTELSSIIPSEAKELLSKKAINNFEFKSADEKWKINLTNNFLALTSLEYTRWENFRYHFEIPFKALLDVYNLNFFTRIGLRYIDVIKRSKIGLQKISWNELLQPYISGVLVAPGINEKFLLSTLTNLVIQLTDDKSRVRIVHGLVQEKNDDEFFYMIDSDFYTEKRTELTDAMDRLEFYNQRGSRLIRWCITDRLHVAMEPESI